MLIDPAQRLIAFGHLENASLLNAIPGNTDLTLDGIADCAKCNARVRHIHYPDLELVEGTT